MKQYKEWLKTNWGALTFAACSAVVLFLVLSNFPTVLGLIRRFLAFFNSVFLGVAIAYVLNPLERLLEERILARIKTRKLRRTLAVALTILVVVLLVILLFSFLIPQLIDSITTFVRNLDSYMASAESLSASVAAFMSSHGIDVSRITDSLVEWLSSVQGSFQTNVEGVVSIVRNVGSHIFDGIIALVFAIYFLTDRERLLRGARMILQAMLKPEAYEKTAGFLARGHQILIRYILFDLLDAVIIGFANFIFMSLLGLPYAALVSFVVAITNLAPTFGPIVGGAIGAFLLVLINPWYALYFLIFTVAVQILDGYILKPRLFGGALGVPGVIVLICIIVGGKMFGVKGVILAIPFAAIAYYTLRETVLARLSARHIPEEVSEEDA